MRQIPILLGKSVSVVSKTLNRSGSTWPGHVALGVDSKIIQKILHKNPNLKLILIAGTNGKTTTAKLIQEVLESQGLKVFRNAAGANLLNGIASSLIKHSNLNGKIHYEAAIFEIDENTLPLVLNELQNTKCETSLLLLNLFRDQLDRYGELNTIAKHWLSAIQGSTLNTRIQGSTLIVNGDDPMLRHIGQELKLKTYYFGLSSKFMTKKEVGSDVDFLYCPNCNTKLEYSKRSYSHMGIYKCPKCKFENSKTEDFPNLPSPMLGLYNRYNINAAATLLNHVFKIPESQIKKIIEIFSPAFGRQEKISYQGKNIFLLLSKNPTGLNQSIEGVLEQDKNPNVLLLLNDRIPDGRDVSWIWDVDMEGLVEKSSQITVSGDRAYDLGLRMQYCYPSKFEILNFKFQIEKNLKNAISSAVNQTPKDKTLYILATYSAMLEARKILKGRSIL